MLTSCFIFFFTLLLVEGNVTPQESAEASISLLNIPENLPVEDLQEGLRVLTTSELKTLSEFIDEQTQLQNEHNQNKRQAENGKDPKNLLGVMENYWTRHVRAAASKKKRNIGDLYDEMAHEYAETPIKNDNNDEDFSEMEALGCTCGSVPKDLDTSNMRTKREKQYAENLEKGYSVEEYMRDLENSFPQNEDERGHFGGETVPKGHLRIKRLKNSNQN